MTVKKKRIEVPESIAAEVKLFAKLMELGEITSVYDLLQKLDNRAKKDGGENRFNLCDVIALETLWQQVLSKIYPPTTQAIFAQKGRLINLNNSGAWIELSSPQLVKLICSRILNVETAFEAVLGQKVKVQIVPKTK